jgi:hypothetical protein
MNILAIDWILAAAALILVLLQMLQDFKCP